ncbi:MAG: NUDIX hydrolase [Proteobacteria bacterium]|nr:NUDIX hydrolase [Pseudomonadota bacterium]
MVLLHKSKILLMRRAGNASVAPNMWNVPAGKVKYDEIPTVAVIRECKEETGIDAKIAKEISCRATQIIDGGETAYRLTYTYLIELNTPEVEIIMNDEHTEFVWVDSAELADKKYDLLPQLKEIITNSAF